MVMLLYFCDVRLECDVVGGGVVEFVVEDDFDGGGV